VDLRGIAGFARALVAALRQTPGIEALAALRAGVHATCPQCQLRLFGEDVLALAASQAPGPETSPKLHRLAQGFCGRQSCNGLFYEFTFDPVAGVDWERVLAQTEPAGAEAASAAVAGPAAADPAGDTRKRTRLRLALGLAVVVVLLLVRHVMTGGTIPWLREPRQFTADPATMPKLGETNTAPPAPSGTNAPRTFRAAPEPRQR
jgi:hypothetical protein